jgi:hypothetical protein
MDRRLHAFRPVIAACGACGADWWRWRSKFRRRLELYDRMYIWDGPYDSLEQQPLFSFIRRILTLAVWPASLRVTRVSHQRCCRANGWCSSVARFQQKITSTTCGWLVGVEQKPINSCLLH